MASLPNIRAAIAAAVLAVDATAWKQVPIHPQAFVRSPDSVRHLGFSIDIPSEASSEARHLGETVSTARLAVRFWHAVKPASQTDSFDAALAAAALVRDAVEASTLNDASDAYEATHVSTTWELSASGDHQLVTVLFSVFHL